MVVFVLGIWYSASYDFLRPVRPHRFETAPGTHKKGLLVISIAPRPVVQEIGSPFRVHIRQFVCSVGQADTPPLLS